MCGPIRIGPSVRPVDSDGVYRSDLWTPMESIGLQKSETPEIGDSTNRRLQKSESQMTEVRIYGFRLPFGPIIGIMRYLRC